MASTITLTGADKAIEAGRAKAGAALASVESSQAKARTSVLFGRRLPGPGQRDRRSGQPRTLTAR
jgi:hypothetical protein